MSFVTYSWFTSMNKVKNGIDQVEAVGSFDITTKYFTMTPTDIDPTLYPYNYVERDEIASITYATIFLTIPTTDNFLTFNNVGPNITYTFAIEISNGSNNQVIDFNLGNILVTLPTLSCYDNNTNTKALLNPQPNLATCFNIYTYYDSANTNDVNANAFIKTNANTSSFNTYLTNTDNFTYDDTVSSDIKYTANSGKAIYQQITLNDSGTGTFFISFSMSNDSSTWFSSDDKEDPTYYYKDSTNGNSNVYEGLSITFSSLILSEHQ